jgi:type IV secretory pathway TraG/TraD family ATPase VirD4
MQTRYQRSDFSIGEAVFLGAAASAILAPIIGVLLVLYKLHLLNQFFKSGPEKFPAVALMVWKLSGSPEVFAPLVMGSCLAAVLGVALGSSLLFERQSLHGNERLANNRDVQRMGLFDADGPILGLWKNRYLRASMLKGQHTFVCAPTGEGKGVSFMIPNLFSWPGSALVTDIKRENFEITSGHRSKVLKNRIYILDVLNEDGRSHSFNVLGYINRDDPIQVVSELQVVAGQLIPYTDGTNPFFTDSPQALFVAIGAYVAAESSMPWTMGSIYEVLNVAPGKALREFLSLCDKDEEVRRRATHQARVIMASMVMLFEAGNGETARNVAATLNSRMTLWSDARVDYLTQKSDFDLRDMRSKRMTIYLSSPPGELVKVAPLYSLIFQQLAALNTLQEIERPMNWKGRVKFVREHWRHFCPAIGWPLLSPFWWWFRGNPARWWSLKGRYWAGFKAAWSRFHMVRSQWHDLKYVASELYRTGRPLYLDAKSESKAIPVMLLLDEFPQFGEMPSIRRGLSFYRSYGLLINVICQSPADIETIYKASSEVMMDNLKMKLFYAPSSRKLSEEISSWIGTYTAGSKSRSDNRSALFASPQSNLGSSSAGEAARAVILPQEIRQLDERFGLLLPVRGRAVKHHRIVWYKDKRFNKLRIAPVPVKAYTRAQLEAHAFRDAFVTLTSGLIPQGGPPVRQVITDMGETADYASGSLAAKLSKMQKRTDFQAVREKLTRELGHYR